MVKKSKLCCCGMGADITHRTIKENYTVPWPTITVDRDPGKFQTPQCLADTTVGALPLCYWSHHLPFLL